MYLELQIPFENDKNSIQSAQQISKSNYFNVRVLLNFDKRFKVYEKHVTYLCSFKLMYVLSPRRIEMSRRDRDSNFHISSIFLRCISYCF